MAIRLTKKTENSAPLTQEDRKRPLFIFDTHPIQYRSPVFNELSKKLKDVEVLYFNENFDSRKWWFHEMGKTPPQNFDLDLTSGFKNRVLNTNQWKLNEVFSRLKTLLTQERPGGVLVYGYYMPEHWALQYLCHKLRIPLLFIGETFSDGNSSIRRMLRGPLLHYFFKNVAHFIAIGDKTHAFYRNWEIPKERITLAKYCVDTRFFTLPKPEAAEVRKKTRAALGIPEDAFVALFVGRLFERKRPHDVLSIHQWYREEKNYHTIIVGNGPMENELKERSKEFQRVHFVGFQNQKGARDHYHAADVLIVPSDYETWGLVINEAFCAGIPAVVTSTCGASGDLVLHGDTGFSYPVGNIPRAISFVDRLVKQPAQAKIMGEQAQKLVHSEYSPELFADAIVRAFRTSLELKTLR